MNDDVPGGHKKVIENDNKLLWDILVSCFEINTYERNMVDSYHGQGYEALYKIMPSNHPALLNEPHKLIQRRPTQGNLSLIEYWNKYQHYCMLASFIEDRQVSLNNKIEMQQFVSGCKYSFFLKEQIRREEHVPSLKDKSETSAMLATLQNYLLLSSSPTRRSIIQRGSTLTPSRRYSSLAQANVNEINVLPDETNQYEHEFICDPTKTYHDTEDYVGYAFAASVNQLKSQPMESINRPCLVCQIITGCEPKGRRQSI